MVSAVPCTVSTSASEIFFAAASISRPIRSWMLCGRQHSTACTACSAFHTGQGSCRPSKQSALASYVPRPPLTSPLTSATSFLLRLPYQKPCPDPLHLPLTPSIPPDLPAW